MTKKTKFRAAYILTVSLAVSVMAGCSDAKNKTEQINSAEANTELLSADTAKATEQTAEKGSENEDPVRSVHTVKELLQTAVEPVGSTLYVYGGGWNEADTGAGESAVTVGVSPKWKEFYDEMDADYDSSEHRYEIENGLDCTGYIGWVLYNLFNTESGNSGYVFFADRIVNELSSMGFGSVIERDNVTDRLPGDIMGSSTAHHAWIMVGECDDGSIVLLHSSPPGVGLCAASGSGAAESDANELVKYYMSRCYPDYYSRYPDSTRGSGYFKDYDVFRWYDSILEDPEGYRNMSAEQILADLFGG